MTITPRGFAAFVLVASIAVLGSVLLSQYWGGLAPCELCLLQRWPWRAAIVIAALAVVVGNRPAARLFAVLLAITFAVSVAFAFYHVGVEQHWFAGPATCTAGGGGARTVAEMEAEIMGHGPVMCDKIAWSLFGVSLAGFNLIASLAMLAACIAAALRRAGGGVARLGAGRVA